MQGRGKATESGPRGGTLLSVAVFLCLLAGAGRAGAAVAPEVLRVRWFTGPDHTRVVLDLSAPGGFEVRRVQGPERLAINVAGARLAPAAPLDVADGVIRRIRRNPGAGRAQVVLDLEGRSDFKSFALPAADGRPHRVVIDVFRAGADAGAEPPAVAEVPAAEAAAAAAPAATLPDSPAGRPFTVVIDPGHGGLDPGAIRQGLQEKDIVLDVALEAARLIDRIPGYRAVLTRRTDYYPSLARRVQIASEEDGDLFLSVHCNTHRRAAVSGMEVYFLSLQGATDREARELADKENAADLVGLARGQVHDDLVMNILMDLRMSQVLHESARLAEHLLGAAAASGVIQGRKIKQARFQVLSSLAMPSALVELAYLSNGEDLALLKEREGRRRLASMLVEGVLTWRRDREAVALLVGDRPEAWTRQYRVRRGDSLWGLARHHGTTVTEITRRNNLASAGIRVGQVLQLPEAVPAP